MKKSFNIQELLHSQDQTSMEPSPRTPPVKSFPKTPRTQSEASRFNESHNYKTKQTTLLLHREMVGFYALHETL
jgi:hypothetical protein